MNIYYDGKFVQSQGSAIPVENPATEEIFAEVAEATLGELDAVVASALSAQRKWARVGAGERAELLHTCAARLREHAPELARLLTQESGKPLRESLDEVEWSVDAYRHLAEVARTQGGQVVQPNMHGQMNLVVREPLGVVVSILPFNFPILLMTWQVAAALAAGNTCIVKPSEVTPMTALLLAKIFDHLPPGIFNVVTCGAKGSAYLVSHPNTHMIAFTGSVPTGQNIMQGATERMKPLLLELGSSDPFIVMDDADFDMAVKAATFSAFLNSGQVCTGSERFFIHEKIYDDFMDALVKSVRTLRIGDPMGDVDLGPLVNKAAVNTVEKGLAHLQSLGATIRLGGTRGGFNRGHFFEPTIVEITDPLKQQPRHELFGPQATFCRIRSLDEAIAHANNTDFGLGSCIFTSSFESAMRAATEIDAGHVWINDPLKDNVAAPFGGKKMSGLGRELGLDGINAFTDVKHIHMQFKAETQSWWFPYTRPDI